MVLLPTDEGPDVGPRVINRYLTGPRKNPTSMLYVCVHFSLIQLNK